MGLFDGNKNKVNEPIELVSNAYEVQGDSSKLKLAAIDERNATQTEDPKIVAERMRAAGL